MAATHAPNAAQAPVTTNATHDHPVRRRVLWAFQILLGLFLIVASASPKFVGQKDAVETFAKIGWGEWFMYVTGVVELAGGIGLLIPRLAGAAATGLVGLMIGAVIAQCTALDAPGLALLPAAFGVIFAIVAWDRRAEVRALAGSLKR
ncbi:DoxX family protein [Actinomadura rudentiformis]|uniref:DoxX family protein n=1 Tax=Actinomadura rudentiformis TaxID=359158 RepID=A0A6H9YI89_9ACTN|nr:DoxX family protein [Actinomadura rudentiformis]KAB2342166.1 DoxX family protein [Actinomadura rudentiformis]